MYTDWSSVTVMCTPGTSRLIRSISSRTAEAIATVFFPDCFETCRRTPAFPLIRVKFRKSSVVSFTSATSFR